MLPTGPALSYTFDPAEALRRWPRGRPVVLLHSGRYHPRWSSVSVITEPVGALVYQHAEGRSVLDGWPADRVPPTLTHDPFRNLEAVVRGDPALHVGVLGYDLGRAVERLPDRARDDHGFADLHLLRCPNALVYDHAARRWHAFGPDPDALPDLADPPGEDHLNYRAGDPVPDRPRSDHEEAVREALRLIAAGDVFQVNLAQRFTAGFAGSTRGLYLSLAEASPAWYGAYLELPTPGSADRPKAVCSISPELFLEFDRDGRVTTRPIKGTRPAAADPDELRDAEKDAAELNMIVDLLRNDLGRVCRYGSVRVTQPRAVESHPTVHHGVATVTGRLHADRSLRHLLRAAFPGGSITGAPKVRAMEIIEQLEPVRRGPYCGAIGWFHRPDGAARIAGQLNIAIRTLLAEPAAGRVRFSVGGGIVADSDPAAEYDETLDKAAAMLRALKSPLGVGGP
ncbi:MAG: anthranilate synthase component I family protein [Planctomycetota bacterium]